MTQVVSTTGATEITHDGVTHAADPSRVFDLPEALVASHGRLLDLIPAAEHAAAEEARALAEASKPESLHARVAALEEVLAGVEHHIAAKVEEALAKIEAAVKSSTPKAAKTAATKP